jgi:hypothetical protein
VDVTQSEVVTSCVRVPQCAALAATRTKGYIVCSAPSPKPRPTSITARKSAACSSRHAPYESAGNEQNNAGIVIGVSKYPTDRDISASAAPSPTWPQLWVAGATQQPFTVGSSSPYRNTPLTAKSAPELHLNRLGLNCGWQGPSRNSLHRAAHAAASCSDGSTGALCNS